MVADLLSQRRMAIWVLMLWRFLRSDSVAIVGRPHKGLAAVMEVESLMSPDGCCCPVRGVAGPPWSPVSTGFFDDAPPCCVKWRQSHGSSDVKYSRTKNLLLMDIAGRGSILIGSRLAAQHGL